MPRKYRSIAERILANSVLSEYSSHNGVPCRIWQGATTVNRSGQRYGKINIRVKRGKNKGKIRSEKVHRVVLKAVLGRILTRRSVGRHLCNNTLCCEPRHLAGGTQKLNMRQMVSDGRHGNMYRAPVASMQEAA